MKTIGIIGGIAPASTAEYYRLIIASYREQKRDGSYPSIIINSINMTKMLDLIGAQKLAEVTDYLLGEIINLAKAGADFGIFASNTPHLVFDDIQSQSPIPLLSLVEATCQATQKLGLKKVGLFGTRFTMQAQFFPEVFSRQGIDIVAPDPVDQNYIHGIYMNELINGIYRVETQEELLAIIDRMKEKHEIQGLILGGTELPFILRESRDNNFQFLDTTKIHVEKVVTEILSD